MRHEPARHSHRLTAGDTVSPLELVGAIGAPALVPPAQGYIHLQLRRFSGCMVCNVHLREIVRRLPEIRAANVQEVIVFHSTAHEVIRFESDLPFTVVADPEKHLYRKSASSGQPRHSWAHGAHSRELSSAPRRQQLARECFHRSRRPAGNSVAPPTS